MEAAVDVADGEFSTRVVEPATRVGIIFVSTGKTTCADVGLPRLHDLARQVEEVGLAQRQRDEIRNSMTEREFRRVLVQAGLCATVTKTHPERVGNRVEFEPSKKD